MPQISRKQRRSSLPLQADCVVIVPLGVTPCACVPPLTILTPLLLSGPSHDVPATSAQNADVVPPGGDNLVIVVDREAPCPAEGNLVSASVGKSACRAKESSDSAVGEQLRPASAA
ncbi:hypothetical protein H6P81_018013 [Aristolochia fimbriata]|uniref:Uncharacterized protein n=1 Tax=Aristolochia fimbriata TaxID=158543 RepID=A0AAV7E067_ARIFI|nr:hypothetical protein H6P81_018013 [Aristolochia fimbriata]